GGGSPPPQSDRAPPSSRPGGRLPRPEPASPARRERPLPDAPALARCAGGSCGPLSALRWPERPIDSPRDLVDLADPVYIRYQPPFPVKADQGLCLGAVDPQPLGDRFGTVVGSIFLDRAPVESVYQDGLRHREIDNAPQALTISGLDEKSIQRFGLV